MGPDQSQIVDDFVTIYKPRIGGGRFAPPTIAGSTSCVSASVQNAAGAFLMLAFLNISSIMAKNEANANGVAPDYKSVLTNENLHEVSRPAEIWADSLGHGDNSSEHGGDELLKVKAACDYRAKLDSEERIDFDPNRGYLFDAGTGERLR